LAFTPSKERNRKRESDFFIIFIALTWNLQ
jgi:hypothetical protein